MKIKITGSSHPNTWYDERVGEVFDVVQYVNGRCFVEDNLYILSDDYEVVGYYESITGARWVSVDGAPEKGEEIFRVGWWDGGEWNEEQGHKDEHHGCWFNELPDGGAIFPTHYLPNQSTPPPPPTPIEITDDTFLSEEVLRVMGWRHVGSRYLWAKRAQEFAWGNGVGMEIIRSGRIFRVAFVETVGDFKMLYRLITGKEYTW